MRSSLKKDLGDSLHLRYKASHAEISYVSTEQQEEDDFHLEEVRGSHSTKVEIEDS